MYSRSGAESTVTVYTDAVSDILPAASVWRAVILYVPVPLNDTAEVYVLHDEPPSSEYCFVPPVSPYVTVNDAAVYVEDPFATAHTIEGTPGTAVSMTRPLALIAGSAVESVFPAASVIAAVPAVNAVTVSPLFVSPEAVV